MTDTSVKENLCRCGNEKAREWHPCPFAEEIGNNQDEEYCNCCDECTHQCAMDI